jgi:flagellar basal-body rod modification protein FlgD
MDVTSATSATAPSKKSDTSEPSKNTASNALTGDFDTFIQLLTAQMNNQDPLEPTSNTEFVAQLASFSSVEQQIQTNDTLASMLDRLGSGQAGEVATWIGKDVLVEGGQARYAGAPIEIQADTVSGADKAVLLVRNADGTVVARKTVSTAATSLTWNGTDQNGAALAQGLYSFQIESSAAGQVIGTQSAKAFSTVSEVRLTENGTQLVVAGGQMIDADEVTAIR